MTLPPERLTVKRSANAEPLDVLCLSLSLLLALSTVITDQPPDFERPQKRRATGRWDARQEEEVQYRYQLKRDQPRGPSPSRSPTPPKPGYPKVGTTKPGEEVNYFEKLAAQKKAEQERAKASLAANKLTSSTSAVKGETNEGNDEAANTQQPRRLFLDIQASTRSAKRKRNEMDSPVAVFVEASTTGLEVGSTQTKSQTVESSQPATPSRKRPNVRATLSTEATLSRNISRQTLNEDFEKAAQSFAEEELTKSQQAEELSRKIAVLSLVKEKDDKTMTDSEIDGDFVYDTYIRCPVGVEPTGNEAVDGISKPGIGFLVIGENEEEFWETFGEDEEVDEDAWDSEQDDENAENWYGADYPEDEVDIDDEYDEDAYRFRVNGSDDGDYGPESVEEEGWTDAEDDEDDEDDEYPYASRKAARSPILPDDDYDDLGHAAAVNKA